MSNLGRTQADWSKLLRELALFLAPQRELREVRKRFDLAKTRTRVLEFGGDQRSTARWDLRGVRFGMNTGTAAEVFVRILLGVPSAGLAQVSLFRAVGGATSDLVAQGVGTPGSSVVLAPANNSGLSGSVALGSVAASETDDRHRLLLVPDWAARMHAVFDGSEPEHGELLESFMDALDASEEAFTAALAAFARATDAFLLTRWKSFQRSSEAAPVEKTVEEDQGAIATVVTGLLEDGRDNMAGELVSGRQTVARTVVFATAGTFEPSNRGRGTLALPVMAEWARPGRVTLVCSDATFGTEQFRVSQHVDDTGEDKVAERELQIRRPYSDPEIGIKSAFLDRVLTFDSGSADNFGVPGDWSILGEDSRNTDRGKIAVRIVAASGVFAIEGYTSATFEPETKVFATAPGAPGSSVAILVANNAGLAGTARLGNNPKPGETGVLNLNPFARGDRVAFDVTLGARGAFQEELAVLYGFGLESDDASKATIDDRFVTAGTLPPFEDVHD